MTTQCEWNMKPGPSNHFMTRRRVWLRDGEEIWLISTDHLITAGLTMQRDTRDWKGGTVITPNTTGQNIARKCAEHVGWDISTGCRRNPSDAGANFSGAVKSRVTPVHNENAWRLACNVTCVWRDLRVTSLFWLGVTCDCILKISTNTASTPKTVWGQLAWTINVRSLVKSTRGWNIRNVESGWKCFETFANLLFYGGFRCPEWVRSLRKSTGLLGQNTLWAKLPRSAGDRVMPEICARFSFRLVD